jgi:hypothetical protein
MNIVPLYVLRVVKVLERLNIYTVHKLHKNMGLTSIET